MFMFILIRIRPGKYPTDGAIMTSAGRKESFLIGQFEFAANWLKKLVRVNFAVEITSSDQVDLFMRLQKRSP